MKGNATMLEYFGLDIFATKGIEYLVVIGYLNHITHSRPRSNRT